MIDTTNILQLIGLVWVNGMYFYGCWAAGSALASYMKSRGDKKDG